MTKNSNGYTNLKTFCITALSFYGVLITLFLMLALFWYTDFPGSWYMYELCAYALGFISTLCFFLSFLWLLITVIWCLVICKKEKTEMPTHNILYQCKDIRGDTSQALEKGCIILDRALFWRYGWQSDVKLRH